MGAVASLDDVTLRERLGAELFRKVAGPDGPRADSAYYWLGEAAATRLTFSRTKST